MGERLNVLLLADDRHPANAVQDHISAYTAYSRHNWIVLNPIFNLSCQMLDFNGFDVVAIHYSLCVIDGRYMPRRIHQKVADFRGPKLQFIQDEYRRVDQISTAIADLGIDTLFTLVRPDLVEKAYSHPRLSRVRKVSVLPGYVPERLMTYRVRSIADRELHIAYRGRRVPYWLGALGQDKVRIAQGVSALASQYGVTIDVSVNEEDRVYGDGWLDFISSAKAVLGTESGASIWDFQGTVQQAVDRYLHAYPNANFEEVACEVLASHEGNLMYNTVSPRVFEAAALRTAMVMFPGWYSGVVEPNSHYIPLRKDFSNFAEVAERLKDDSYLQAMVDRTFNDIVASGRFSKRAFIQMVDRVVDEMIEARTPYAPVYGLVRSGRDLKIEAWMRVLMSAERCLRWPVTAVLLGIELARRMIAILFDPRFSFPENMRRARALGARAARLAREEVRVWTLRKIGVGVWLLKRVYGRFQIVWPAWRALRAGWYLLTDGSHDHLRKRER